MYLVDGRERDVVVQELAVLHEHERVAPVEVADVGVHDDGDEARRGERLPALAGAEARPRDGCKEAETNGRSEWPAQKEGRIGRMTNYSHFSN